jgi:hypothetical protein
MIKKFCFPLFVVEYGYISEHQIVINLYQVVIYFQYYL